MEDTAALRKELDELERILSRNAKEDSRHVYDVEFDVYKHLTTLSAGTIVILAAFAQRPTGSVNREDGALLAVSLAAMILSVIIGYCGMMTIARIQGFVTRVGQHAAQYLRHVRINHPPSSSESNGKRGVEERTEIVMGMLSELMRFGFVHRLHPYLMIVGSISFISGLIMLAVLMSKSTAV